jgi:hypothetical protein
MITKQTFQVTCYTPSANSELESTLYLSKPLKKSKKAMDRAIQLLSSLYGRSKKNGFVELYSVRMARKYGCRRSWGRIVKALIAGGWIEKDHSYHLRTSKRGAKCQGYRLTAKALDLDWIGEKKPVEIESHFDGELEAVAIDAEKALETLRGMKRPHWAKAYFLRQIETFSGHYRIGRKTGRLFTSANRLCEELRACVLIDGKPVAELDVKNCQPLLMFTLYPELSEEGRKFCEFVESGKFYEGIAEFLGITREKAKSKFTVWLGGGVNVLIDGYFSKFWPELAAIFARIKKGSSVALCHDLQKKESRAIVEEFPNSLLKYLSLSVSLRTGDV